MSRLFLHSYVIKGAWDARYSSVGGVCVFPVGLVALTDSCVRCRLVWNWWWIAHDRAHSGPPVSSLSYPRGAASVVVYIHNWNGSLVDYAMVGDGHNRLHSDIFNPTESSSSFASP